MVKRRAGSNFPPRGNAVQVFSYDGGRSWASMGLGRNGRPPERIITEARQAAGLRPDHTVRVLGGAVVGMDFEPPLDKLSATQFAARVVCNFKMSGVEFLIVSPGYVGAPLVAAIPAQRLPSEK